MGNSTFKTIIKPSSAVFKDRRSVFYAFAYPIKTKDEADEIRKNLRKEYYDARHYVYALRLGFEGDVVQLSDDKEPHNSSAPAVLSQIKSFGLTNILIVVIRYFGGKKLGISGLINAYKTASKMAIENAEMIKAEDKRVMLLEFDYANLNSVMGIISKNKLNVLKIENKERCIVKIDITQKLTQNVLNKLKLLNVDVKLLD